MNGISEPQPQRVAYALPLHKPFVTYVLLAIIIAVFGLETLAGGSTETEVLIRLGAKVTPLVAAGEYWRLFTSMFLHIGVTHLFFNGYALFAIGPELERLYGWQRFLLIYVLAGLLGSLASYALTPGLSAGASGAIFGLIGAQAAFFARYRDRLGSWGQRRLANIAFLIVINLVLGVTQAGIDNLAHLGGLVGGLILGWALVPRYVVDPMQMRMVDLTRPARYWPVVAISVIVLIVGTALVTILQQDSVRSYLYRAEEAVDRSAWDDVIVELEQALDKDPDLDEPVVYFYLGLAHNNLDQSTEAATAYETALSLSPNDSAARWNLALTYLQLERYDEARSQLETYLQQNPDQAGEVQPYLDELDRLGY